MENTSGQGKTAVVPQEVRGLAWGAFFWTFIWGIFNRTWIALLVFVPLIGFVMPFVLLFKGREWAWRNRHWDSVEHFNKVQRRWAMAFLVILLAAFLLGIILAVMAPVTEDHPAQDIKAANMPKPAVVAKTHETGTAAAPVVPPAPVTAAIAPIPEQAAATEEARTEPQQTGKAAAEVKSRPPVMKDTKPAPAAPAAADVNAPEPDTRVVTPEYNDVMTAVFRRNRAAVIELLDLGWWVNKPDTLGMTPLMAAVDIGDTAMAELLLKRGADPNLVSSRGNSALRLAKRNKDTEVAALLKRHGATVE